MRGKKERQMQKARERGEKKTEGDAVEWEEKALELRMKCWNRIKHTDYPKAVLWQVIKAWNKYYTLII